MKGIASFVLTLLLLASVTIINGCGGSSSPIINPPLSITVSVSAGANAVEASGAAPFIATVTGDASGQGVTWSVSCSAAQCGSVSPQPPSPPNTYNANYTAPPTPPPSDLIVTVKATSVADGSKSGSATITVSAITMSVNISGTGITASTATTATVQVGAGNLVQMNASVNNDPSNQGVKFTISPSSQAGNLIIQDSFDATYNAPTTPPASDLTVTVTATSVTDSTKTATVTITVPSVTIAVTPTSVDNVEATSTVPNIVATVGNDPSNKGVTWSVSCPTAPCGSVPAAPTLSGNPTTYTAPPTPPDPTDLTVTVTATSVADPAAQGSMTITVKAISVVVTPDNAKVLFGTKLPNIVAVVNFDPAKKGVTWAIQPCGVTDCGSISSNATATEQPISYTAPASPPANDVSVTIVATSDSDAVQTGSINITVPAITVSVLPTSAIIPVGATAALNATPFTATVNNDSSNQGATWTLTQNGTACSPASACGTIMPTTTTGCTPACSPTTYAAPSTVPTNSPQVTITAMSLADTSKSATATITLTMGTVKLIPASLSFFLNKFARAATKTVALTNTGSSALNITGETTTGTSFSINTGATTCAASAASGASCNIGVTFSPASAGSFSGTLTITDSDTSSPQQIPLKGQKCGSRFCGATAEIRSAIANNQVVAAPSPTGPNKVGTRVMNMVDSARFDPFLGNGSKRELLVRFWYPAALTQRCSPAPYTSASVWNYLATLEKVPAPQVKTNSCQDAAVTTGAHPVVVFTHGYTGTFTDYTFLFEDLASRGYIVASVNHTFEATATQFPDGRLAKSVLGSHIGNTLRLDEKATSFAVTVRLADLKFVMDELARENASRRGPFAGKLDLSHVAVAGHSLGGMTALLGLRLEPRFGAAISMDGVLPGPLFGATQKPVLMLFAGHDAWDQDTCHLWSGLHGPRLALNFKGSEHLTPSDAVWLANGAIQTGTVGMESTVAAIRNYIAAFLETNLKGISTDSLLQGASSDYPDVEVTTQTQSLCGKPQSDLHK